MQPSKGTLIAIEGTDASDKSTQFERLAKRLQTTGYVVATFKFPRYEEPSCYFVKQYLNGAYGAIDAVGPYTASLFYALDRYQAEPAISQALEAGKVVLVDRFTGSNMAHQGTKFKHPEERRGFFIWLDNLEFELLRIPRPSRSIVLRIPADTAQQLVDQKPARAYTDRARDLHEADLAHLHQAVEVFDDMCQLFPKDFVRIDCVRGGKLLSIEEVNNLLWEKVVPLLPTPAPAIKTAAEAITSPTVSAAVKAGTRATDSSDERLANFVTSIKGPVYALRDTLPSIVVNKLLAKLTQGAADLRSFILASLETTDLKLFLGEAGISQPRPSARITVVVERVSSLLVSKLRDNTGITFFEPRDSYIPVERQTATQPIFYVPTQLDPTTRQRYTTDLQRIISLYGSMVGELAAFLEHDQSTRGLGQDQLLALAQKTLSGVLPAATFTTIAISSDPLTTNNLTSHLLADDLAEAQTIGQALSIEADKLQVVSKQSDDRRPTPTRQLNNHRSLAQLAQTYFPSHAPVNELVSLSNVWPRNELALVADMLYDFSDQPLTTIEQTVDSWSYQQKVDAFQQYMAEELSLTGLRGRALENAHYAWDVLCDYGLFRELQRSEAIGSLSWQPPTVRYGYDIPSLVETVGLTEDFEHCFSISFDLYNQLQQAGYADASPYTTLFGHRMRCSVSCTAMQAFRLFQSPATADQHPGYQALIKLMHEKMAEVHPLLTEHVKPVNANEDAESTPLAAGTTIHNSSYSQ